MGNFELTDGIFVGLCVVGVVAMVCVMLEDLKARRVQREENENMERLAAEVIRAREQFREKRERRQQEIYDRQFKSDQAALKAQLESFEQIPAASRDDMDRYDRYMVRQAEVVKYPMPKEEE